jgi:hypothetical protein
MNIMMFKEYRTPFIKVQKYKSLVLLKPPSFIKLKLQVAQVDASVYIRCGSTKSRI